MGIVFRFPARAEHYTTAAAHLTSVLEERWSKRHLPLLASAIELLELDDAAFEARVATMRDAEGVALVTELVDELRTTGAELEMVYRASYLTQTRLQAALGRLQPAGGVHVE